MKREIVIRDAEPTVEEGLKLAGFVIEITGGLFGFMLGRNPEAIIAETYTKPKHDLSYQNAIFAQIDDVIVGMAAGYTANAHHTFSDRRLIRGAGRRAWRVRLSHLFLLAMFRALNSHDSGDFYVHYLGVHSEYRGRGIGTALLEAMEARANAAGSGRFALDVAASNRGAIAVYERFGMKIVSKWPKHPIIPAVMYRMAKPLRATTASWFPGERTGVTE